MQLTPRQKKLLHALAIGAAAGATQGIIDWATTSQASGTIALKALAVGILTGAIGRGAGAALAQVQTNDSAPTEPAAPKVAP